MVDERTVLFLAMLSFSIGLFLISTTAPGSSEISVSDASKHIGKTVSLTSQITSIRLSQGNAFLSLGDLSAVAFSSVVSKDPVFTRLSAGDIISAEGEMAVYEGEPELVIRSVRLVG